MATALELVAEVIKGFSHSSYMAVKELISLSTWKYCHNYLGKKQSSHPHQTSTAGHLVVVDETAGIK